MVPDSITHMNEIPKTYVDYQLYNNLLFNEDDTVNTFEVQPRIGSLEVSYKGKVSGTEFLLRFSQLIYSKLGVDYWPNVNLVAKKCAQVAQHEPYGCDFRDNLVGMTVSTNGSSFPSESKRTRMGKKGVGARSNVRQSMDEISKSKLDRKALHKVSTER